jgi:hypothetical protein
MHVDAVENGVIEIVLSGFSKRRQMPAFRGRTLSNCPKGNQATNRRSITNF